MIALLFKHLSVAPSVIIFMIFSGLDGKLTGL